MKRTICLCHGRKTDENKRITTRILPDTDETVNQSVRGQENNIKHPKLIPDTDETVNLSVRGQDK